MPPRLGWESGWCWDNVVIQLLYNMRGVTECLLKNADECRQKNEVLAKYIDLITAIRKNPNGFFLEEMRAYHAEFCGAMGCKMCDFGSANVGIRNMLVYYLHCCRELCEVKIRGTEQKEAKVHPSFFYETGESDSVAKWIVEDYEVGIGHVRMENIPGYLLLNVNLNWKVIDEYIDLAPRLSDELKKTIKTCPYELIGAGAGFDAVHRTAYIKDQWEANPSWYYCDDMAARHEGATHQKIGKWPESGPWPGKHLELLVYKRVGAGPVRDDESLERLVWVLRDLAG